jgi:hypothetical protein
MPSDLQNHVMDITVTNGGEVSVKVHFRDQVPELLSRFPLTVARMARMSFWLKSPYERKLLKAARSMPWWARRTVRQHLLRDRAVRIEALLKRIEQRRRSRLARQAAHIEAHQRVRAEALPERIPSAPSRPASASAREARPEFERLTTGVRESAASALSSVERPVLSLTEQLARKHGTIEAVPPPALVRARTR